MARDKAIKQAAYEYINSDAVRPENMQLAFGDFINGAEWADAHPQNPWISVEDMLPDEFKKVIVMFDSGIIIDAFMTMVKDEPAWHPSVEIPIGSDVIFWMPIPELKKGGKK